MDDALLRPAGPVTIRLNAAEPGDGFHLPGETARVYVRAAYRHLRRLGVSPVDARETVRLVAIACRNARYRPAPERAR